MISGTARILNCNEVRLVQEPSARSCAMHRIYLWDELTPNNSSHKGLRGAVFAGLQWTSSVSPVRYRAKRLHTKIRKNWGFTIL